MTATERRYMGNSDEIASMDDPDLYGETFELLSFKRALESKPAILSDYKIVTIQVTRKEVAGLIKRNVFVKPDRGKWDADVEAESFAALIALRKAMKKYPIRHAISFHNSIARARAFQTNQDSFSSAFPEYGKLDTFHVSGKTPTAARSRQIDTFEAAKRGLITNARCLTEGVDVPNIDCILFADPRKSAVDIVQAVGRALRVAEGKKFGYVVIPVLLDDEVTDGNSIQKTAFDAVLMVLRALGANDERIIEYFRSVSQGKRWRKGTRPIEIDVPEDIVVDAEGFINSVELQFWSRLAKLSWRPFEEACAFVHSIGLKSENEWRKYCKGELTEKGILPKDIPATPGSVYKDKGWGGMGDWLGTGTVASQNQEFRIFKEARAFVHSLRLKSNKEWREYCKGSIQEKGERPENISANPQRTYKNKGWKGWGDWLGTGAVASQNQEYLPFNEARTFVHNLKLRSQNEWGKYCKGDLAKKSKLPRYIPSNPHNTYKDKGWKGFGDWLGTGSVANFNRKYRSFNEACAFVCSLGLKSESEWRKYCKGELTKKGILPKDIPASPGSKYKNRGWKGMRYWLGAGTVAPRYRKYRTFNEARTFVHNLELKGEAEWRKYRKGDMPENGKLPEDIPAYPENIYKKRGWKDWGDWLGTGNVSPRYQKYRPFNEARAFVRSLGLKSRTEWRKYCNGNMTEKGEKSGDIPKKPDHVYKDKGWKGMGDWLGTGTVANFNRKYRTFKEARAFVHSLGLKSYKEWREYSKGNLPEDIPADPYRVYNDKGWIRWPDWLGTVK